MRADLVFVSPVFATRSHLGRRGIGIGRAKALSRASGCPGILLGGMTPKRWRGAVGHGFAGWAAIDALA